LHFALELRLRHIGPIIDEAARRDGLIDVGKFQPVKDDGEPS
jgi:hypothetical protein